MRHQKLDLKKFAIPLAVSILLLGGITHAQTTHTVNDEAELTAALSAASAGDTIALGADITLTNVITSTTIPKLILKGSGYTLTGNGYKGFLFSNDLAGIQSITIDGAYNTASGTDESYGGAVHVENDFTGNITGSTFSDNRASGTDAGSGGAVYVKKVFTGNITNSTFTDNTVSGNNFGYGGAVLVNQLTGNITNSRFSGNSASGLDSSFGSGSGGAVFVFENLDGSITHSTFADNTASGTDTGTGGAVHVWTDLTGGITSSEFTGNMASATGSDLGFGFGYGGAVHVGNNLMDGITSSEFTSNKASGTITDSNIFFPMPGEGRGGAVHVVNDLMGGITNSTFSDNTASGTGTGTGTGESTGGAVHVGVNFTGNITGSTFSGNTVSATDSGFGGAVHVVNDLTGGITSSTFTGNWVSTTGTSDGYGSGGAVYVGNDLRGDITSSTFTNNKASGNGYGTADGTGTGGAVYVGNDLTSNITNSTFSDNTASGTGDGYGYGGAVYVGNDFTGNITGSTFSGNTASGSSYGYGGVVYVSDNFLGKIVNSTFTGNSAKTQGGAIYVDKNATITVPVGTRSVFTGNTDGSGLNSMFFGNWKSSKHVNMDVMGELLLHDPIAGRNDNLSFVKTGSGHLLLGGTSNLNRDVGTGSTWDIQAGKLTLTDDSAGNAGAITGAESFTLGNDTTNTTLVAGGVHAPVGQNTITANTIDLNAGNGNHQTTLSFGLTGANAESSPTSGNAILNLNTSTALNITGTGKLHIDLQNLASTNDNYTLVFDTSTSNAFTGNVNTTLTLRGQDITSNSRLTGLGLTIDPNAVVLNQTGTTNALSNWTGAAGDGVWDIISKNWELQTEIGSPLSDNQFISGDAVRFNDTGSSQTITVNTDGVTPAGMVVDSTHDYTFTGGEIILTPGSTLSAAVATGELDKLGSGTLTLNNKVTGNVNVQAGKLGGHGQIAGTVTAGNGATIAPGSSIGTLSVGDIIFQNGSTYEVEGNPNGTGDKIMASNTLGTGTAQIDTGSILNILGGAGIWNPSTSYTILQADSGITGTFTNVATNLAFLSPTLDYSNTNQIGLTLSRNDVRFANIGTTYNQRSTGFGIESLQAGNPVYNTVASMNAQQAQNAFDNLSGEIHASVKSAALTNSRYARGAINQHLNERPLTDGKGLWVQTWYHDGHLKSDGNAQKLDNKGFGIMLGADAYSKGSSTVGVALGYEQSDLDAGGTRRSSADMDAMHLMAYGRTELGAINIRGALGYSWLDIDSKRYIGVGRLQGTNKAGYDGNLFQAYVEGSQTFEVSSKADVIPYVNLAYQRVKTDSFTETPSLSTQGTQLHHNGSSNNLFTSTIGARGHWQLNTSSKLYANLGWQHSFGNNAPKSRLNFIGGQSYTIKGIETDRNAAVIGLGAHIQLKPNQLLDFGYEGLLGNQSRDHGARVQWALDF